MTMIDAAASGVSGRIAALPRWLVLTVAGVGLVVALGLPTLIVPFAADQVWFSLGARTIRHGHQLYRDFWDQKPPLIYLLYAVPFAVGGEHEMSLRVFDLLNVCAGMAGLFVLGRRFFTVRAGCFAAALYAFAYLSWTEPGQLAETEGFMAAPLAFALALYVPDDGRRHAPLRALASGLLLGVVFSFKAPVVLLVLVLPAAELLLRDGTRWSGGGALKRLTLAAVGFAVVPVALVLYMAVVGVLGDFLDIQRHYTLPYNRYRFAPEGTSHVRFVLDSTAEFVRSVAFLTAPAFAGALFAMFRKEHTKPVLWLVFVALLGVATVWWQGKMFGYHWVLLLPLLAVPAGYALDQTAALTSRLTSGRALGVWAALVIGFVVLAYPSLRDTYDEYRVLIDYTRGSVDRREVDAYYFPKFAHVSDLVDYVRANSSNGDRIYVWGLWPRVDFLLSDREPFDRFTVNSGLRATWSPQKYRDELMADLRAAPPRFIAIGQGDRQPELVGTMQTSQEYLDEEFPEFRAFLEQHYTFVGNFEIMTLYERQ